MASQCFPVLRFVFPPLINNCTVCKIAEPAEFTDWVECVYCRATLCVNCTCPCVPEPTLTDIVMLCLSALPRVFREGMVAAITDDLGELLFCTEDSCGLFTNVPVIGRLLRLQMVPLMRVGQGEREVSALVTMAALSAYIKHPLKPHTICDRYGPFVAWMVDVIPCEAVGGRQYIVNVFTPMMN